MFSFVSRRSQSFMTGPSGVKAGMNSQNRMNTCQLLKQPYFPNHQTKIVSLSYRIRDLHKGLESSVVSQRQPFSNLAVIVSRPNWCPALSLPMSKESNMQRFTSTNSSQRVFIQTIPNERDGIDWMEDSDWDVRVQLDEAVLLDEEDVKEWMAFDLDQIRKEILSFLPGFSRNK